MTELVERAEEEALKETFRVRGKEWLFKLKSCIVCELKWKRL